MQIRLEKIKKIEADKRAGKANCQAVYFDIDDARDRAKKFGIVGDESGELAKRML